VRLKHVALHVPDIEAAERFYRTAFDMEVVTRESIVDGRWRQLPHEAGWEDVRRAGVEIQMVGLSRGDLIVALFPGDPKPGTVFLIGVVADPEEIEAVRSRLPEEATIAVDDPGEFVVVDPFGFRWQLSGPGFAGPGDTQGDWIDL
jgi:catechol 2,3-dioxygenase-like lactoylglutathione lyase family enzyme